jgi:crotonobetainyl-CoA:carnitine CoA-transferase CaiB-like acyl-CoA transferase
MTINALADLRVVDLTSGVAGAYATKLFADAGADVVMVEPPAGVGLRRMTRTGPLPVDSADGPLFRFLAAGKRSTVGDLDDARVAVLLAEADLIVEDLPPGTIEAAGLLPDPSNVIVSITPYGRGPLAGRPGNDFTAQAVSGSIASRGYADREPIFAAGRLSELAAGIFAAPAALAAVMTARRTGVGAHIDVSGAEAIHICTNMFQDLMFRMIGFVPPTPARSIMYPGIERTADGWIGLNTNSRQKLDDFLILIGRGDLIGEIDVRADPERKAQMVASGNAWLAEHTTADILEQATALRIPVAPIGDGESVLEIDHFVERKVFVTDVYGGLAPRPPYTIDGERPGPRWPAPAVGDPAGQPNFALNTAVSAKPNRGRQGESGGLPLTHLKVLDLTAWWAGPSATQFLAALGADVIHVESIQVIDGMRPAAAQPFAQMDDWWERSSFFLSINPNKRDITLDLNSEQGRELLRGLIAWADVMVENYTPRVVEAWGLGWEDVRPINPRLVMVRMPAFGLDGPWRDRVGFAQTMEQVSGLSWTTGYRDGAPVMPTGPCDPLGGMHAAFAILAALARKEQTGVGCLIECPLVESALNVAAEEVLEYDAFRRLGERLGNRSPERAPQGVYRCRGDEQWLAISIENEQQWGALVKVMGSPGWAMDPALKGAEGRIEAHDAIDARLVDWLGSQDRNDAAADLMAHGVPAAPVVDSRDVLNQPLFIERGFAEWCDHPVVGRQLIGLLPYRWSGIARWIRQPAPTLGQHNHEVLSSILGLTDDQIGDLEDQRVIGTRPLGL